MTQAQLERDTEIVTWIHRVAVDYRTMGYALSVRQLFYMLPAPIIAKATGFTESDYARLNELVLQLKIDRALDWDLVDEPHEQLNWPSGEQAFCRPTAKHVLRLFETREQEMKEYLAGLVTDPWEERRWMPEVWLEKNTVSSAIREVCRQFAVPWLIVTPTQSMISRAAGRMRSYAEDYQQAPAVILATDYDPEGLQLQDTIPTLLRSLCQFEVPVHVVAVTRAQLTEQALRPKPGTVRDRDYLRKHGSLAWELESLDPRVLRKAVADTLSAI